MSDSTIGDGGAVLFAAALTVCHRLQQFCHGFFSCRSFSFFLHAQHSQVIQSLHLTNCGIKQPGAKTLATAALDCQSLKTMALDANPVDVEQLKHFHGTELQFSGRAYGAASASVIATLLGAATVDKSRVQNLQFSNNSFTDFGLLPLLSSLSVCAGGKTGAASLLLLFLLLQCYSCLFLFMNQSVLFCRAFALCPLLIFRQHWPLILLLVLY